MNHFKNHFKKVCRDCGRIIAQCRCMDCNKRVIYSLCEDCAREMGISAEAIDALEQSDVNAPALPEIGFDPAKPGGDNTVMRINLEDSLTFLQAWTLRINEQNGFTCPDSIEDDRATLSKLMLVVTELAEAAEAVRHGDFLNFREELADTVIRILHIAEAMHFDLGSEIVKKLKINEKREHLHGKVSSE